MNPLTIAPVLLLVFASCSSLSVPLLSSAPEQEGSGQGTDLDSVIYQGDKAEKAKLPKKDRNAFIFLIGNRALDQADWDPVEGQIVFGAEWTWIPKESVVGVEIGTAFSFNQQDMIVSGDNYTFTGSTFEAYLGPRFETALGDSPLRVYAGLGPSFIGARFAVELFGVEVSDSDTSFAFYAHAGVLVELGKVYLGLDIRTLNGSSITMFDYTGDADYTQVAFALGFRL